MTDREKFDSFLNGVYRPRSDDEIDFDARTIKSKNLSKGIKLYIYKMGWMPGFDANDPKYSYKFEAYTTESEEFTPSGIHGGKKYVIVPSEEYFKENKVNILYNQGFISDPSEDVESILYAYGDFGGAIATEESMKKGMVTRKSRWQLAYNSKGGTCYWVPENDKHNCSDADKIYKDSPVDVIEGIPESPEEAELPPQLAPADTGEKITVYLYNESSGRWTLSHQQAQIFEAHKDLFKRNPPAFLGNYWKYMYTSSTGFAFSQLEYPTPVEGSEYNEMREMTLYERYKAGLYQLQPDDEVDDANKVIRKKKPGETPKPGGNEGGEGTSPKPGEVEDKPKPGEGGSGEGGKKPDKKRPSIPRLRPNIPNIPRFGPSTGFVRPRPSPVEPERPQPAQPAPVKPEPARPEPVKPIPPIPEPKVDMPLPPQPDKGKLQLLTTGEIKLDIPDGGTMSTGGLKIKFIFPVRGYETIREMEGEF